MRKFGVRAACAILCMLSGCATTMGPSPSTEVARHPLDPLSSGEIVQAREVIRRDPRFPDTVLFAELATAEPRKGSFEAWAAKTGARRARAIMLDRSKQTTHEVVVDLSKGVLEEVISRPGVQPAILGSEFLEVPDIVRSDPTWQEAIRRRGISDYSSVQLDVWAPGSSVPGSEARQVKAIAFLRGDSVNPYARPIEGVIATVDTSLGQVVHVADSGVRPIPPERNDFFGGRDTGPARPSLRPLVTHQPEGPSYTIEGNLIRWDRWRFRYAIHPREGVVLHTVGYEDRGKVRPVLYRAALSEMVVPYGDSERSWSWRSAFDEGEYGLGVLSSPLRPGKEVPAHATVLEGTFADDFGEPYSIEGAALYEEDRGVLWTHYDEDTKRSETRRARSLVLYSLVTIGNYDYGVKWIFGQDGTLRVDFELTGILLTKGTESAQCGSCGAQSNAQVIVPKGDQRYGKLVGPNVVGTNHQHFFSLRLDFDVDGTRNGVREVNVRREPLGDANPLSNAFIAEETVLTRELDARRWTDPARARKWKIVNESKTNALGHFTGYMIEPHTTTPPFLHASAPVRQRASFLDAQLWVTKFHDDERYAAGMYPNQRRSADGLSVWSSNNERIRSEDVVVWCTLGLTHLPRAEDWPVMPAAHAGLTLLPAGFFDRNPALDLPE